MGDHVAVGNVVSELERNWHCFVCGAAGLFAPKRNRAWIMKAASENLPNGHGQDLGTVQIEELSNTGGHETEVATGIDPPCVERIHACNFGKESVAPLGDTRGALVLEQLASMLRVFDALMLAPASGVPCDHFIAIKEPNFGIAGDEREGIA
jgi:hypothetical protein